MKPPRIHKYVFLKGYYTSVALVFCKEAWQYFYSSLHWH